MKKIMISIVMLIALFAMTTASAEAQCPTGYSETTITMQVYGCDWEVKICYKCGIGPAPASVSIIGLMPHPGCQITLPFEDVYQQIKNEVMTWQFIEANLCSGITAPPCDPGPPTTITYRTWLCWKVTRIEYFGEETDFYGACNYDDECFQTYEFCYNNGVIERTLISSTLSGNPSCYLQSWQVTMPEEVGEESDCFVINTDCTP